MICFAIFGRCYWLELRYFCLCKSLVDVHHPQPSTEMSIFPKLRSMQKNAKRSDGDLVMSKIFGIFFSILHSLTLPITRLTLINLHIVPPPSVHTFCSNYVILLNSLLRFNMRLIILSRAQRHKVLKYAELWPDSSLSRQVWTGFGHETLLAELRASF